MSMFSTFNSDVQAVESECPITFKRMGKPFTCQGGERTDLLEMADGGLIQKRSFEIVARVEIFSGDVPQEDELVEVFDQLRNQWINCRIDKAIAAQDNVTVRFSMVQDN